MTAIQYARASELGEGRRRLGRRLAWCGVLGPVVIALAAIVASLAQDDADVRRNTLSEHGADTADKAWLWNVPLSIGGILIVLGAIGIFLGFNNGVRPRIAAVLIGLFGVGLALEGVFFELDCQDSDLGCEERDSYTWHHDAHDIEGAIGFVGVFVAAILLAAWFRRRGPRTLFVASLIVAVGLVLLVVGWEVIDESSWGGVIQRVLAGLIFGWIALVTYHVATRRAA